MILEPYMVLGGVEIANSLRTLTYLARGLGGFQWTVSTDSNVTTGPGYPDVYSDIYMADAFSPENLRCYCAAMDPGTNFGSPEYDEAPWWDAARPESGDFLGMIPRITLLPVAARNLTRRAMGRGDIGPLIVGPRIIQVEGAIYAGSRAGMGYGERWVTRVLAGIDQDGCAGDSLTVLPYCNDDDADPFRELIPVGIIDGPTFSPPVERATCQYQEVRFQLAAGDGWLRRTTSLYDGALGSGSTCEVMTAPVSADSAAVINIQAGPTILDNVEISGGDAAYTLVALPALHHLYIDASRQTITVTDSTGVPIGAMNYLDFTGMFEWLEVAAGDALTVCVDATAATGTAGATLSIDQVDLEL